MIIMHPHLSPFPITPSPSLTRVILQFNPVVIPSSQSPHDTHMGAMATRPSHHYPHQLATQYWVLAGDYCIIRAYGAMPQPA